MKESIKYFEAVAVSTGALLGWYLGTPDGFLYTLLAFVLIDYLTGVLRASVEKNLSSAIGFKGIAKKVMIFSLVGAAHLLDVYIIPDGNDLIRTTVVFFYISNEGLSIIENSIALGLPIPKHLKLALKSLKDDNSESEKEE